VDIKLALALITLSIGTLGILFFDRIQVFFSRSCPLCKGAIAKAIFAGLPVKLCRDEGYSCVWGPGTVLMRVLVNKRGWVLWGYKGSYLVALWHMIWNPSKWDNQEKD
jgi:hypothetical protein